MMSFPKKKKFKALTIVGPRKNRLLALCSICLHSLVCNRTDDNSMLIFIFFMFICMKYICIAALKPIYTFTIRGMNNRWNSH